MQKRENLFTSPQPSPSKERESIGIDLYYPWALVFTGRLCDTSAIENEKR
jgi:hypothetical protein